MTKKSGLEYGAACGLWLLTVNYKVSVLYSYGWNIFKVLCSEENTHYMSFWMFKPLFYTSPFCNTEVLWGWSNGWLITTFLVGGQHILSVTYHFDISFCHVLSLLSVQHHSFKYSGKLHLIMKHIFLLNSSVRIIWNINKLCLNGIVHFCLNKAQDNKGSTVWTRSSFNVVIHISFKIKGIHKVSVSKDTLTDIILCCLHWWRKQKKATQHIFWSHSLVASDQTW